MKFATARAVAASALLCSSLVAADLDCDPLTTSDCPADTALSGTVEIDLTSGASSQFTSSGDTITYESDGAHFTVAASGDSPTIASDWYIMFGKVDVTFQSSTGVGMCSTAILLSDDADEIDWEILGAYATEGQTNYFGKGNTTLYNREVTVADTTSQTAFNKYTIDWNAERIIWSINDVALRTLLYADADYDQYPQTPMKVKVGAWAPGDPTEAAGTIEWAGGDIDYSDGPFTMIVSTIEVTDYSTGTEYKYVGTTGDWEDITAVDGTVNPDATSGSGSTSSAAASSSSTTAASSAASSSTETTAAAATSKAASSTSASLTSTTTAGGKSSSTYETTGYPWVVSSTASGASTVSTSSVLVNASSAITNSSATTSSAYTSVTPDTTGAASRTVASSVVAALCLVIGLALAI